MANKKKGLGKGLGALLGEHKTLDALPKSPLQKTAPVARAPQKVDAPSPKAPEEGPPDGARLIYIDPTEIQPNPKQPRHTFAEEALQELSESIRRDGVQEPVIVREVGGSYELVSGERRVRASVMADLPHVPAICRNVSDEDMLKLGLIENLQREDLNAIELALAYQDLVRQFNWTQEELAEEVGKKRATVANTMRLLNLPEVVQEQVADGSLSMGHARALLAIEDSHQQLRVARKVIKEGLSVRQTEKLAAAVKEGGAQKKAAKDPNLLRIEDELRRVLGTKVALKDQGKGRGKIEIEYYSLDDFERIVALLR